MSRQSVRKVKLTSKFEEFSNSRLPGIQRLAHADAVNHNDSVESNTPSASTRQERLVTPKVERDPPKQVETPKTPMTPANHHAPSKERTPHKVLRQKAVAMTPITPAYESTTPTPHSHITGPLPKLTANGKIRGRPRKCWQKAETVVKPMSSAREELIKLREENAQLRIQFDQKIADYEELKRQSSYTGQTVPKCDYEDLKEKYNRDLMSAKRHEWCVICLNPSRYYCCWNTTYCSQKCQVHDWYQRHMKHCERRKRRYMKKESEAMLY